jgi:outer membrane protein W
MRNTALTLLTGLALAATAQAGEDYSAKAPAPVPAPCLWEWFAGGSVGYAFNAEAAIYNVQVGSEYSCPGSDSSHAIFVEIGYGTWDDSTKLYSREVNLKGKIDNQMMPFTLNYKYETSLTQSLNWFIGAGAGFAINKVDIDINAYSNSSDNSTTFYGQLFAGLVYQVNEQWDVTTSVRYLYQDLGDHKLKRELSGANKVGNNGIDDIFWDIGVRYNF